MSRINVQSSFILFLKLQSLVSSDLLHLLPAVKCGVLALSISVTFRDVIKCLWHIPQCVATSCLFTLAVQLNQKQWVHGAPWNRSQGLHDYRGRTCFVHTVHWHTALSAATVLRAAVASAPWTDLYPHALFPLSHTAACLTMPDYYVSQLTLGLTLTFLLHEDALILMAAYRPGNLCWISSLRFSINDSVQD